MKLPNSAEAGVPQRKITEYLLSPTHPDGRAKAAFFTALGFTAETWEELATALRNHAQQHEVAQMVDTPYGTTYVVEGALDTPSGRTPNVRIIWFIESGESTPRLVTAYPLKEAKQ